jgi:hypothetical protein
MDGDWMRLDDDERGEGEPHTPKNITDKTRRRGKRSSRRKRG